MSDSCSSHSPSPSGSNSSRSKSSIGRCLYSGSRLIKPFMRQRKETIFAPSTMLPGPSYTDYRRSSSAFVPNNNSSIEEFRKTSAPNPPTHFQQPMTLMTPATDGGFGMLSIDTFGGETAGSGMDYVTQLVDAETSCNQSTKRAQLLALSDMRNALSDQKERLEQIELDEITLNAFAQDEFHDELAFSEDEVQRFISQLETELENLRAICPAAVPPPIPARPRRSTQCEEWSCVKCNSVNHADSYRCLRCRLPRLAIDPEESVDCSCRRCSEYVADHLPVSSDQGTDWIVVDPPNISSPHSDRKITQP